MWLWSLFVFNGLVHGSGQRLWRYGDAGLQAARSHSHGATTIRRTPDSPTEASPRYLLQPTPHKRDNRLHILFVPHRRFGVWKIKVSSPTTRYDNLGRRAVDLHRSIAPPLHWVPAVKLDVIGCNQGEENGNLCDELAPTFSAVGVLKLTPTYDDTKSGIENGCTNARQLLNKINNIQKQSP
jgi:hypothetical protein